MTTTSEPQSRATTRIYDDGEPLPKRLYLDSSILLDLWDHEQATTKKRGPPYKARPDLVAFLTLAQQSHVELITTPLALAEVFGELNWRAVKRLIKIHNCEAGGEKELRHKHQAEHSDARKATAQALRSMLSLLRTRGTRVTMPVGGNETAAQLGRGVYDRLQQLVESCHDLGAFDALHVVLGGFLACDAFVSRDGDFQCVPAITVFRPRTAS